MDATQRAVNAAMNGNGGGRVTGITSVRFYPNALGKGFLALGISFIASAYAGKQFKDAFIEAAQNNKRG
jgi:ABC-type uncharacterized transport system permease subunit